MTLRHAHLPIWIMNGRYDPLIGKILTGRAAKQLGCNFLITGGLLASGASYRGIWYEARNIPHEQTLTVAGDPPAPSHGAEQKHANIPWAALTTRGPFRAHAQDATGPQRVCNLSQFLHMIAVVPQIMIHR